MIPSGPGIYASSGLPVSPVQPMPAAPEIRELRSGEFVLADKVWIEYHETKGDPQKDRIFAVFEQGSIVSLSRCRCHPGGCEVDGIFTPLQNRKSGYSRLAVGALVEACHNEDLYMYAVRHLTGFYARFGFAPVPEKSLPPAIRERYTWAVGNLEGAEVQPMCRKAGL